MPVQMSRNVAKALLLFVSHEVNKPSYQGVWFSADLQVLMASDNHAMLIVRTQNQDSDSGFIPEAALRDIARKHTSVAHVTEPGTAKTDGATRIQARDSMPDFMAVVPRTVSGERAYLDHKYLRAFDQAASLLSKRVTTCRWYENGDRPAVTLSITDAIGVLMPCAPRLPSEPFALPGWLAASTRV